MSRSGPESPRLNVKDGRRADESANDNTAAACLWRVVFAHLAWGQNVWGRLGRTSGSSLTEARRSAAAELRRPVPLTQTLPSVARG